MTRGEGGPHPRGVTDRHGARRHGGDPSRPSTVTTGPPGEFTGGQPDYSNGSDDTKCVGNGPHDGGPAATAIPSAHQRPTRSYGVNSAKDQPPATGGLSLSDSGLLMIGKLPAPPPPLHPFDDVRVRRRPTTFTGMEERPAGIQDSDVREALRAWGIDPVTWRYAPVGFGDYHWTATDTRDRRWFVTVADLTRKSWYGDGTGAAFRGLRDAMDTAVALRDAEPDGRTDLRRRPRPHRRRRERTRAGSGTRGQRVPAHARHGGPLR